MVKRSLANASIVVSVIMIAVAAVGWWRVGSLSTDVNEAQSEVALQREKTSELTDDLEDMPDDLMQVEDALARARARASERTPRGWRCRTA
jgi:septal ring factor EnvC (AmiA/AmiB activator)